MKIACLVMANSGAPVLARSLAVYHAAGWDVFVHIDAKVPRDSYIGQLGAAAGDCRYVDDPVSVFWAGFTMIEAELKLIALARRCGAYDKFVLVSDDTLPLYPAGTLNAVLTQDRDFITAVGQPPGSPNATLYAKYLFPDHDLTALKPRQSPTAEIDEMFERAMLDIASLRRIGKKPVDLYYGSQFWALSRESIETILAVVERDRHLMLSFRYSSFSDEMFFHTILGQEKHKGGIASGPVYADFYSDPGKTGVFSAAYELPYDLHGCHLFVRKINPAAGVFLDEALARLMDGHTVFGDDPDTLRSPQNQRNSFRGLGSVTTVRLMAPPADADTGDVWSGPGRYLQQLYRWTTSAQVRWTVTVPDVPAGRLRCYLPVVISQPGFLSGSRLTALGQTKPMTDTRYSLIAEFLHDGIGGEIEIVLDTPPPVAADPARDPRTLGLGITMAEPPSHDAPPPKPPARVIYAEPNPAVMELRKPMQDFLRGFSGQSVLFYPNPGNADDSLVAAGEYAAFVRAAIRHTEVDFGSDVTGGIVFLGGGGNLVPPYESTKLAFERFLGKAARIVLLPHTVRGHEDVLQRLDATCTIFCRDVPGFEHVRTHAPYATVLLEHDMAFHVDAGDLLGNTAASHAAEPLFAARLSRANLTPELIGVKREINFLRADGEAIAGRVPTDADISSLFDFGVNPSQASLASWCLLKAISLARAIRTDRLHAAIAAALLGKPCTLLDNANGKNAAVYEHSLRGRFGTLRMEKSKPAPRKRGSAD